MSGITPPQSSSASNLLQSSGGIEAASDELLASVGRKRSVTIAAPGDAIERHLNTICVEGSCFAGTDIILLRANPSKAVVLEEYLHGVQYQIGIQQRLGTDYAEWHVNDFMIRNAAKLSMIPDDVQRLEDNRAYYASLDGVQEKIDSEAARKAAARAELRTSLAAQAEHHASRGMGATSLAVNVAEGNYTAATLNAAGMAADTKLGAEVVETVAENAGSVLSKLSPKLAFSALAQGAKRTPFIGAGITLGM